MPDLTAKRTLVKSPPELWEELSEVEGLAKHLGAFGEIKITKLEPEHTVAWEGEHASGTVSIEPSGWGTKVTLHAELPEEEPPSAKQPPAGEPVEDQAAVEEPVAEEPAVEEASVEEPAAVEEPDSATEEPVVEESEPIVEDAQPGRTRRGFWGWLFRTRTGGPTVEEPEPVAVEEPEPVAIEPEPVAVEPVAVKPEPVALEPEPDPVEPEPVAIEPEPEPIEPADEGSDPMNGPMAEEGDRRGGLTPAAEDDEPEPAEPAVDPERARAILDEALDALGAAHHRPFSRG